MLILTHSKQLTVESWPFKFSLPCEVMVTDEDTAYKSLMRAKQLNNLWNSQRFPKGILSLDKIVLYSGANVRRLLGRCTHLKNYLMDWDFT